MKEEWDDFERYEKEKMSRNDDIDLRTRKMKMLQKLYKTPVYNKEFLMDFLATYLVVVLVVAAICAIFFSFNDGFTSGYDNAKYVFNLTGMVP